MKTIRSFKHAFKGLRNFFKEEQNARVEASIAVVAILFGFRFQIDHYEWIGILLCIGAVLSAEAFNTAIEALCDKIEPDKDPMIAKVKDVAAGAVLILAIVSTIVGLHIFLPYVFRILN